MPKSPGHVLAVLLTAEAEVLCSCRALRSVSDEPLGYGPGHSEGCLGHSASKDAAPNDSIPALLPLQEGREKLQSGPKSGLTSQKSCPPYR